MDKYNSKDKEIKGSPQLLHDVSATGRERPWRRHKSASRAVAASMYRAWSRDKRGAADLKRRSDRMQRCGSYLTFGDVVDPETGEVARKLKAAEFCRDRLCPMCAWRKSLVMFQQAMAMMGHIDAARPGLVPVFLTLTVRNVPGAELSGTVTGLLRGWSRMFTTRHRRRPWAVSEGWMRSLEITYNKRTGEWHPHIHAIVLMPKGYFRDPSAYMDHAAWVAEWRWAMGLDYDPVVDVRAVYGPREKAVAEVAKYAVKPGDIVDPDDPDGTDERVALLARVMRNRRLVAYGGVMKDARRALSQVDAEEADLVHVEDGEGTVQGDVTVALYRYEWRFAGGRPDYVLVAVDRVLPGVRDGPPD